MSVDVSPMHRAFELAQRALGWCSPNPAVGAVILRGSETVGEGFTQPPGCPHAEVVALKAAGTAAAGAVLYVTLEPCSHQGRTPPCTDAIIGAGVAEVRAAMLDPSPWVNGLGVEILRAAGITVHVGEGADEARKLNEAYFKWVETGLPFVTLKYAMTVDGKIATRSGSARWITGADARRYVARLRSQVDAVLVGVGTVLADDPQLTARPAEFGEPESDPVHQPWRIVLDSRGRLPATAKLLDPDLPGRTLVCSTDQAPSAYLREMERRGAETMLLPQQDGRVDIDALMQALGRRGVTSILAECGGTLAASLLAAGMVDKVLAFVAPKIVGGVDAPTPVAGQGAETMEEALSLHDVEWTMVGPDALFTGYVSQPSPQPSPRGRGGMAR